MHSLGPMSSVMDSPLSRFFSGLRPKGVTEALHQGAPGRYMIKPIVTINPLDFMAAVTVLILWRCNWISSVCFSQSL